MHSSAAGAHARKRRNSDLRHSYPSSLQPIRESTSAIDDDDDELLSQPIPRVLKRPSRPGSAGSATLPDDYNISLIKLNSRSSSLLGRSIDDICNTNNLLFCREGIWPQRSTTSAAGDLAVRMSPHGYQTASLYSSSRGDPGARSRANPPDQEKGVGPQTGCTMAEQDTFSLASSTSEGLEPKKKSKGSFFLGCIPCNWVK